MQITSKHNSNDLMLWLHFNDFIDQHPNFNTSQLEWLYRQRDHNGFRKAFRKIGKLRYVHAGLFAECIQETDN